MSKHSIDQFLEACGADGPLQLDVAGPDEPQPVRRTLPQPFALVGRDTDVDLVLPHPDVSRRHAYLQVVGGRLFCADLRSRTGVYWPDGSRPAGWVGPDEPVRVGPYSVRPARREAPAAPPGPASAETPAPAVARGADGLPGVTLEFVSHPESHRAWRMNRSMAFVGRSPDCRIQLTDEDVSKFHCALLRTPAGLWAVDLLGRGGIAVNGEAVRFALLENGDCLELASYRIRACYDGEPFPLPSPPAAEARGRSLVPSPARPPAAPEPRRPVAPAPLAEEFMAQVGLFQQQMFDQFQDTMMAMARMFGALHREQTAQLREEIERLRQLTAQVMELQAELGRRSSAGPYPEPPPFLSSTFSPPLEEPTFERLMSAPPEDYPWWAASEASANPVPNGAPPQTGGPPPETARPPAPTAAAAPVAAPEAPPSVPPAAAVEDDVHVWLSDRIASLQRERQTRWQSLLDRVFGKRSEGPP